MNETYTINLTKNQICDLLIATTTIRFNFEDEEKTETNEEIKESRRRSIKKWKNLHDEVKKQLDAQMNK